MTGVSKTNYLSMKELCVTPKSKKEDPTVAFLKVYPKASDDIVWLESAELLEIVIYDSAGKVMLKQQSGSLKTGINITGFDKGLYWIEAEGLDKTFSDKFMRV